MKTTVDIADSLFEEAKAVAASRGMTFRQILEEGLRAVLSHREKREGFRLRDGSFGPPPGTHATRSWAEIRETIYQGRGE
jgi:hypothetical protein